MVLVYSLPGRVVKRVESALRLPQLIPESLSGEDGCAEVCLLGILHVQHESSPDVRAAIDAAVVLPVLAPALATVQAVFRVGVHCE